MCLVLCMHPAAELLTTDKLSELACLTLYLMYEKKVGDSITTLYSFISFRL